MNEEKYLKIKNNVLVGCDSSATIITVPESVTTIEEFAFWGCRNLREIIIPNVRVIRDNAFVNCSSLQKVTILDGLISIGNNAFYGCFSLQDISFPKTCINIGKFAFSGCEKLERASITGNIDDYAFKNCLSLKEITVENSIKYVGENIFYGCFNIKKINISKSVNFINQNIFFTLDRIENIHLHKNNNSFTCIDDVLYNKDKTILLKCSVKKKELEVPSSVRSIANGACINCLKLEKVDFSDKLITIGNYAFKNCRKIEELTFPWSVEYIGCSAFEHCFNLKEICKLYYSYAKIELYIDKRAFFECIDLEKVWFIDNTGESDEYYFLMDLLTGVIIGDYAFFGCKKLQSVNFLYYVDIFYIIIGDFAFMNCENLKDVIFDASGIGISQGSIYIIRNGAFQNCNLLEKMPNCINLGKNVFKGCNSLGYIKHNYINYVIGENNEMIIPENTKNIPEGALSNNNNLEKIIVDSNNEFFSSIDGVLYDKNRSVLIKCPKRKREITIPNSVTSIGNGAFYGCEDLEEINVDSSNVNFSSSNNVLYYKDKPILIKGSELEKFTNIEFENYKENSYYSIVDDVLYNIDGTELIDYSKSKKEIFIPASVEHIHLDLDFENINVDRNNKYFSSFDGVLYSKNGSDLIKCPNRKRKITIPNNVLTIGDSAFRGCKDLEEIIIPNSVKKIGKSAFSGCENLKEIIINYNVCYIGKNAFNGLKSIIKAPKKLYGIIYDYYNYYYYYDYYDYDDYDYYDDYYDDYYNAGLYYSGDYRYKYRYSRGYLEKNFYNDKKISLLDALIPDNCVLILY